MDNTNLPEIETEIEYDYEPAHFEHMDNVKCPDCGSEKLWEMPRASGPDDYVMQTECRGCGSTWED